MAAARASRLVRHWVTDDAREKGHAPIDETEAREVTAKSVTECNYDEDALFMPEAMVGTEPVLDAAIGAVEKVEKNKYAFGAHLVGASDDRRIECTTFGAVPSCDASVEWKSLPHPNKTKHHGLFDDSRP